MRATRCARPRRSFICSAPSAPAIGWFYGAVIAPFVDFFRTHRWMGLLILAMIGLYRLPDFIMGTVARPMYRQSFSLIEIGTMSGLIGVWVTILGALFGGFLVFRFGIMRSLLIGLVAVIVGNLMYALAGRERP